jgi:hypothetical protein
MTTAELAQLVGKATSTVQDWKTGDRPRPAFELERRQAKPAKAVWWRITAVTD